MKEKKLYIRIDSDMRLRLEKISEETGLSFSDIIRFSLNNFFDYFELFKNYFVRTKKD